LPVIANPSNTRYKRLFEAARDGILIVDIDTGKIMDANPFVGELLEYQQTELIGRALWDIGLLTDTKSNRKAFRELRDKGYVRYDNLPLQTKSGDVREVEFVSNVYLEDGRQVIQCNIRDISERRQAERHLRRINDELIAANAELH